MSSGAGAVERGHGRFELSRGEVVQSSSFIESRPTIIILTPGNREESH